MKNKIILVLIFLIFQVNILIADEYIFEVSKIDLKDKGNKVIAQNGKISSKEKNINISAKKFLYLKDKDYLEAYNGKLILTKENLEIKFNSIQIKEKNIFTASDGIKINDLQNSLEINSEKIVLDRSKNILSASDGIKINDLQNSLEINSEKIVLDRSRNILKSPTTSTLIDKNQNIFKTRKFEYDNENRRLKLFNALIKDNRENEYEIEYANIDLNSNTLLGDNVVVNLDNSNLNPENEPRLKGEKVFHSGNITSISNGVFTTCKKTEKCPPWELSAEEIVHDQTKKSISYQNVWLNVYDIPLVYFPKFFHPDPSVKRQSGFLMPTFRSSPNKNTYFSIPYYKVLSKNKDYTITPRLYAKDQILIQNEYRDKRKDFEITSDFSVFKDKKDSESHLFLNLNKTSEMTGFFNDSKISLNIEQTSNDTYLKANKLTSPIITDYDLLENSLNINMSSDNSSLNTEFIIYENLNRSSSDKYEYIFPRVNLVQNIENKTSLPGNFQFESDNFIHNYNTNVYEKINTNNIIFSSIKKITKKGFSNDYEFIIKNSNTASQNSKINKEGQDNYMSGLFQFNTSYPLVKNNEKFNYLLKPKISVKINPGHTKDLSKNEYKIGVDNIFDLERISSNETLESGFSIAYGSEYILSNKINTNELLSIKFANNLRLKENDDIERNNQLGSKTSNFFGQIMFSPMNFLTTKYDLSTSNNLSDINYQNLVTEIKFDKFVNTFDYLRQDGDKSSYFLSETTYNFNDSNNVTFSTREDLKSDLTEYYNLIYQYKNDCLSASVEYQKDFYSDRDIKPSESIFLKLTIIPFGSTSSPNLIQQ